VWASFVAWNLPNDSPVSESTTSASVAGVTRSTPGSIVVVSPGRTSMPFHRDDPNWTS